MSRRWRLQFSLRLVIGAITVSAVLLGVRMYDAAREKQATARVRALGGITVLGAETPCLRVLKPLFFSRVFAADLTGTKATNEDLLPLVGLKRLETLKLGRTRITSGAIEPLTGLSRLERLCVEDTQIGDEDLDTLDPLDNLISLQLHGTRISDRGLVHLRGLPNLEAVSLHRTSVTAAGLANLAALPRLKTLWISAAQVDHRTLRHLQRLPALANVWVHAPDGGGRAACAALAPLTCRVAGFCRTEGTPIWTTSIPWSNSPAGVVEKMRKHVELSDDDAIFLLELLAMSRGRYGPMGSGDVDSEARATQYAGPDRIWATPIRTETAGLAAQEFLQVLREPSSEFYKARLDTRCGVSEELTAELVALVDHPDRAIWERAAYTLVRLGGYDEEAVAALGRYLKAEDPQQREVACSAVAEIAPRLNDAAAAAAAELVIGTLAGVQNGEWLVSDAAANALGKLALFHPSLAPAAIKALLDARPKWDYRGNPAYMSLIARASLADPRAAAAALPDFFQALAEHTANYRTLNHNAAWILGAVGYIVQHAPDAAPTVTPVLLENLEHLRQENAPAGQLWRVETWTLQSITRVVSVRPDQIKPILDSLFPRLRQSPRDRLALAALLAIAEGVAGPESPAWPETERRFTPRR